MVTGCNKTTNVYSFSDPDIVAYINGQPVYSLQEQKYIDIKKLYAQGVVNLYNDGNNQEDLKYEDSQTLAMEKMISEIEYKRAVKLLSYNDQEWDVEYYKTFVIDGCLSDLFKNKPDLEDIYQNMVNATIDLFITSKAISTSTSSIDAASIMDTLEKKYNLTDQEFTETVFKPFLEKESADEFLLENIGLKIYNGKIIEYNGSNLEEYKTYWEALNQQYDQYIDNQLKNDDIVKRKSTN